MDVNTVVIAGGLLMNLLAIVGFSNRQERRMTRVETLVTILASRAGIHSRVGDSFPTVDGN